MNPGKMLHSNSVGSPLIPSVSVAFISFDPTCLVLPVKRTSPDTENHEQNGYAKVHDDKCIFMTNVDKSDTTYTDKHKDNMREV